MPTESDLRHRLRDANGPDARIDVDAVVRRARARRRPKAVLAGAATGLAAFALVTPLVLTGLPSPSGGPTGVHDAAPETLGSADDAAGSGESALEGAPLTKLNPCEGPLGAIPDAAAPLTAAVSGVVGDADGGSIATAVTVTNTSAERIRGWTLGPPALTLSRNGVVLWHSNGPTDLSSTAVDLAPGESLVLPATFDAVRCAAEDESLPEFRDGLPALEPGDYRLTAALEVTLADRADAAPLLVVSEPAAVRLE